MASITSLTGGSNSTTSSIYGNRNVISGLASGLDTETLIENSVSGYTLKAQQLKQEQEKISWKQDAYRDIIDNMASMLDKYTSYTSKTNLMSMSFFTSATTNTSAGTHASSLAAVGRATSTVQVNSVSSLATASTRFVSVGNNTNLQNMESALSDNIARWGVASFSGLSTLKLEMTLDSKTATINIGEGVADNLLTALGNAVKGSISSYKSAADLTDAQVTKISSGDIAGADLSDKQKDALYQAFVDNTIKTTNSLSNDAYSKLSDAEKTAKFLANDTLKGFRDILAGNTKIQSQLDTAFGKDRVTFSSSDFSFTADASYASTFQIAENSQLGMTYSVGNYLDVSRKLNTLLKADDLNNMDFGTKVVDNAALVINGVAVTGINSNSSISEVMTAINNSDAKVKVQYSELLNQFTFTSKETGEASDVQISGALGEQLFGITDTSTTKVTDMLDGLGDNTYTTSGDTISLLIGSTNLSLSKDATIDGFISAFNNHDTLKDSYLIQQNSESGAWELVEAEADENGKHKAVDLDLGSSGKSVQDLLNSINAKGTSKAGQDAKLNVTINGQTMNLTRSSNDVKLEGLSVTLKSTFETGDDEDPVTFKTEVDADKIVETVASFVTDFNSVMTAIHDAYSTKPLEISASKHTKYEPLTDKEKESMTESAIKAYEEKAKTGLLYGDSDLYNLYDLMRSTVTSMASARKAMEEVGLTTSYDNGVTTFVFDEEKMREVLNTGDIDKVRSVFVRDESEANYLFSQDYDMDSATDRQKTLYETYKKNNYMGLMSRFQDVFKMYANTSVVDTGILVNKAGSKRSAVSLMNNSLQTKIDNLETQIDSWNTKISAKIDFYTRQYTALEQMISTMNNQSSMLAGLSGY